MIRTIKSCIKKEIGRRRVDFFQMMTILSDMQLAVNCRPLTYISGENMHKDPISPIDFISPLAKNNVLLRSA